MNIKRATHIARHKLCVEKRAEYFVRTPEGTTNRWLEFWRIVVDALEKATPKKPAVTKVEYKDGSELWFATFCPVCNKHDWSWDHLVDQGAPYCRRCGQRLDWSSYEEGGKA